MRSIGRCIEICARLWEIPACASYWTTRSRSVIGVFLPLSGLCHVVPVVMIYWSTLHREKKKGDTTLPDSSSSLLISLLIFQWGKQKKRCLGRVDRSGVHSKYQEIVFPTAAGNASIHPSTPSSIGLHLKRLCPHEVTLFDMSIFNLGFQISVFNSFFLRQVPSSFRL